MQAVIMQKCFIFLRFTKLCSCVELYSPKKLLATSLGDPNCSTISSYFMGIESVKALDMDVVAPGYTEVGYEEVNDREWSEEDGAWLMLFEDWTKWKVFR